MVVYAFQCAEHGPIDVRFTIGTAPPTSGCPRCGSPMRRLFSPPGLRLASRPLVAVLDRAERSRTDPEVVTSLPRRAHHGSRRPNPAHARLPRP
jgi:putative FmdB family regulatory protein